MASQALSRSGAEIPDSSSKLFLAGVAAASFLLGMIFLEETHGTLIWEEASTSPEAPSAV